MSTPLLLHVADTSPVARLWTPSFRAELERLGTLKILPNGRELGEGEFLAELRSADVLLTGWGARPLPLALADDPGRVRYVCHLTGTLKGMIPIELMRLGVPITNWGDAPAFGVAEGAVTLLLASLKNLRGHIEHAPGKVAPELLSGSLRNLRMGVYGLGQIGRRFCAMVRPFGCRMIGFDPHANEWPEDVERVDTLEGLFRRAHAVAIHAGLNDQTRGSVNAEMLRLLPDGGIVVNTARGDIVDQDALFAEVSSGRLRAGLDVLAGRDWLPPEHPAHGWPNLLYTHHHVAAGSWPWEQDSSTEPLSALHEVCLANLKAFLAGRPLRHQIDERYFALST